MGLYDRITPSERAVDLSLVVKRIRRHTGLDVVPMLVVEGPADESLLGKLCVHGEEQVFAAGTRGLVEQLLVYLRANPIAGCNCVYLTDCDGRGKAVALKTEDSLVVTECCDVEADLVALGTAERVVTQVLGDESVAGAVFAAARSIAIPVSAVRRAANRARVSMKRDGLRIPLLELPWEQIAGWKADPPSDADAVRVVAAELGWTEQASACVAAEMPNVGRDYRQVCSGKDVVDAAYRLLKSRGARNFASAEALHRAVLRGLNEDDVASWMVGSRLRDWEAAAGCKLLGSE